MAFRKAIPIITHSDY